MEKQLKLFATDMDGTFLHDDRTFNHEKLHEILQQFTKKKLIFAASSGRSLLALTELFADFRDEMAFVAENGGVVAVGSKIIFAAHFSLAQVNELIGFLRSMPYSPQDDFLISGLKGAYMLDSVSDWFFNKAQLYYPNCQKVASAADISDDLLKITTNFPEAHTRECENWINTHAPYTRATTTGFTSIDIIPAGLSKATGLAKLLDYLSLSKDNLAVFGDQMNDYEMLQYAGTAYAVSNASPEILAIADKIIGTNNDDTVLAEIEQILATIE